MDQENNASDDGIKLTCDSPVRVHLCDQGQLQARLQRRPQAPDRGKGEDESSGSGVLVSGVTARPPNDEESLQGGRSQTHRDAAAQTAGRVRHWWFPWRRASEQTPPLSPASCCGHGNVFTQNQRSSGASPAQSWWSFLRRRVIRLWRTLLLLPLMVLKSPFPYFLFIFVLCSFSIKCK